MMAGMTKVVAEQLEEFAIRLKRLRLACGYESQKAFSDALGIEEGAYGQYERGRSYPKPEIMGRIRQLTGATSDWLYFGDDGALPVSLYRQIAEVVSQGG